MSVQADIPAKSRFNPIVVWGAAAITVLITALVLWFGWPAEAAALPAGSSKVEIYFLDDELTTPAATGERDGWFGRFSMPCDADSWYVESAGTAMCATLDGPKGTVTVEAQGRRIELPADAQQALARWVTADGDTPRPTRALLVRDGEPVGVVALAGPGTATPAS